MTKEGKKQKIDWHRTWKNNLYVLKIIHQAHPWIIPVAIFSAVLGATSAFLTQTYLLSYALNAMQEGKTLREILITVGIIFAFVVLCEVYWVFQSHFTSVTSPLVGAFVQKQLQHKARTVELACFEDPAFYDTYIKATDEVEGRTWQVLNNLTSVLWVLVNTGATVTLMMTIDPVFILIALLLLCYTLLVGKKRNRLKFEKHQANKVCDRQKEYVRRTFYLSDFSKEMRLTEMWKVMFRQMGESIKA